MGSIRPVIGTHYDTGSGSSAEVIAVGTRGIVVEYNDGRVELIDNDNWQVLQQGNTNQVTKSL